MTDFTFNQTIEYIDGTRDLDFEAAQKWAQEHGTTFVEDVTKREPYEQEHEETYMNPTTGETEVKTVSSPTIKRFFVIGDAPVPYVPTEDELKNSKRLERDDALNKTMWRIQRYQTQKEAKFETTESDKTYVDLLLYAQYLRDFPQQDGEWWNAPILTFEEWGAAQ